MKRMMLSLVLLAGCARTEGVVAKRTPPQVAPTYVSRERLPVDSLPAPPAPGTEAQKADEAAVLEWQAKRTDADCVRADATFYVLPSHLWGERSPFPQPLPAEAEAFFNRLDAEFGGVARDLKNKFGRPRPALRAPCPSSRGKKTGGLAYPSTHAAMSRLFALVLADLVPERRAEFIERADAIAYDRLVIGVHFPTDLTAGKLLADRFHDELVRATAYQADLALVRTRLSQSR